MTAIGKAKYLLYEGKADEPFDLVLSPQIYNKLNVLHEGANIIENIKKEIGGEVFRSKAIKGALMFPHYDEDFELTIGQDFAIGYEGENGDKIRLFITESLQFRVLDTAKIVSLK